MNMNNHTQGKLYGTGMENRKYAKHVRQKERKIAN